jgi:hypothetical protein
MNNTKPIEENDIEESDVKTNNIRLFMDGDVSDWEDNEDDGISIIFPSGPKM